jgi:hypothetical protein
MPGRVNYIRKPKLRKPLLIAGLPGIAQIAKLAVEYMVHELKAQKFAELYTDQFPEWVIREGGLITNLKVNFHHCRPKGAGRDFILVTADAQAATQTGQYQLSDDILDVAVRHRVDTVATMAAYALSPGERKRLVVGVAIDAKSVELLRKHGVDILDTGMIVGMNGLLLGLAKLRKLKGFCLLGATEGWLLDVKATEAVLRVLREVLNFKLDLTDLHKHVPRLPRFRPPRFRLLLPPPLEEEVSYIR